jgi:beta-N-acetylhexosaminidase
MIGHWAKTPLASTTELIKKHQLGGVIIMSTPKDPHEIALWTKTWQESVDYPLMIAVDQEGGEVSRLNSPDFDTTGQRNISTVNEAYNLGLIRGKELKDLGINMNFAPVLDSATYPTSFMYNRVFENRALSPDLAAAMIQGMAEQAVTATPKHFPGHADTADDSHTVLPTVAISRNDLDEFVAPFAELITTTPPQTLMTAHVIFPNIDSLPATLSSFFLTDYLRGELGYSGLIITDDMSMDAIDNSWGAKEGSRLAILAGADIILFAAEPTRIEEALNYLESKSDEDLQSALSKSDNYLRSFFPSLIE